jgi:hypothetical protein
MYDNSKLLASLDAVRDVDTFLAFVKELIADCEDEVSKEKITPSSPYGPGANGWENGTIEAFLGAAVSWAEASEFGIKQRLSPDNHWRQFAQFL